MAIFERSIPCYDTDVDVRPGAVFCTQTLNVQVHPGAGKRLQIFCHRTQYVNVGGKHWEDVAVTSGFPLGRVLGPTLFIYFIRILLILIICHNYKVFHQDSC